MQIKKKQDQSTILSGTVTSGAMKVAWEYAAIFPVQLALARWTRGGDIPHTYISARPAPIRATWYDRAQWHFQAWLEEGGFHRPDADNATCQPHDPRPHAANDYRVTQALILPLCVALPGEAAK